MRGIIYTRRLTPSDFVSIKRGLDITVCINSKEFSVGKKHYNFPIDKDNYFNYHLCFWFFRGELMDWFVSDRVSEEYPGVFAQITHAPHLILPTLI